MRFDCVSVVYIGQVHAALARRSSAPMLALSRSACACASLTISWSFHTSRYCSGNFLLFSPALSAPHQSDHVRAESKHTQHASPSRKAAACVSAENHSQPGAHIVFDGHITCDHIHALPPWRQMRRVRPALLGEPVVVVPLGVSVHTVRIPPGDAVPRKLLVKFPHICLRQQCGDAYKRSTIYSDARRCIAAAKCIVSQLSSVRCTCRA